MSMSDYLTGRRVYNGASNAPTRGTVDPMGYVERGLMQRRSGLAAAALARLAPGTDPSQQAIGQAPDQGMQAQQMYSTMSGAGPTGVSGPVSGGGPGAGPSGAPTADPLGQSMRPILKVSETGKLRPENILGRNITGKALPFDADAADARQRLQGSKNRFESDMGAEQGRIERDWMGLRRGVEKQMPDARRNLLENYAGRGMAYSSGYGYDQGQQEGQFAETLSGIDQSKTDGLADLLRQLGLFNDEHLSQQQAIEAAAARRLAEQAGDLNLEDYPYENRYNDPDYNPNPLSPVVGAPSIGGGVANGPGRNLRPNPAYQAPVAEPTPVVAPGTQGIFDGPFKRLGGRRR